VKFVNSHQLKEISPIIQAEPIVVEDYKPIHTVSQVLKKELNVLKDHFSDHGYIYTLSLVCIFLLLILVLSLRISVSTCCKRIRRHLLVEIRRQQLSRSRDKEINNMVMLYPTAPEVPSPPRFRSLTINEARAM